MATNEQKALNDYLIENFEYGKWFTIEEICANVKDDLGFNIFELNKNPKCHDKCVKLSKMVKDINYNYDDQQKLIIKNKQGSIKFAETKEEFDAWRNAELNKLEKKWKYLNSLRWKEKQDGTTPLYTDTLNKNKDNKTIDRFMSKTFALYCHSLQKVWIVNCDSIVRENTKTVCVVGGKYHKYRCPCEQYTQIASTKDIENSKYRIVDLTK